MSKRHGEPVSLQCRRPFLETKQWPPAFDHWTRKWIRHEFWRVERYFGSREDAYQECAELFCVCCNKKGHEFSRPSQMMGYYQSSVRHLWVDAARKSSRETDLIMLTDELLAGAPEDQELLLQLAGLSDDAQTALVQIFRLSPRQARALFSGSRPAVNKRLESAFKIAAPTILSLLDLLQ